jgi:predicted alpha/beta superfamily hydrolase
MKRYHKTLIVFLIAIISIPQTKAQEIAKIETIKINSKELNQKREILVYTPDGYNESPYMHYNIIYVFDAQNREFFDYTHSMISFLNNASKNFIVVGITSPYNKKLDYSRRNDFLPFSKNDPKKEVHQYEGNVDNFLNYIKNEVIPYIDSHYRTLNHNTAVGHSLGASFVFYSLLNEPDLFDNYIAISPNFAFDKERFVVDLYHFDFSKLKSNKFLYLSNANEAENWKEWKPAREKVYSYLKDSLKTEKLNVFVKDFSSETHWSTFPPSLNFAFKYFLNNIYGEQQKELSKEEFEVVIKVKVPNKNDEVFITGNQINLGNWTPNQIKMNKKSDFERELKVKIHSPAQFKFTKGSWETEAEVKNGGMENVTIIPENEKEYNFEILRYNE